MDQPITQDRAAHDAHAQKTLLKLVKTSSEGEGGHEACISALLDVVAAYFQLPLAIISRIDGDRYEVEFVRDESGEVAVGQTFELPQTYCERVISLERPLYVHLAADSIYADHPCYRELALETYVGVRLFVDGDVYGTLNLTAQDQRERAFSKAEITVFETAGALISHHLALREADWRLALAVTGAAVGLWLWDMRTDSVDWSPRFLDLVGITDPDFKPCFDDFASRLHPDDRDRVIGAINDHLAQKKPYDIEYRLRHEGGHYFWVRARGQAEWKANGQAIRMAGSIDDITERKNAETRASDRLRMMEMAGEAAEVGYIDIDPVARRGMASDEAYSILGLDRTVFELSLEALFERVHPGDRDEAQLLVRQALKRGALTSRVLRFVRADDGSVRVIQLWVQALKDRQCETSRFFGVIQDVTAQRANEQRLRQQTAELRRSNTELEHFASVASHDLQEPLRKVSAFGELVLRDYDDALDARGSGMVNTMVDAAQRMQQLIHDLLQYSRSSHVPLKLERIAIDALMGEVVEHLEYAIRDSGGHLEWPEDAHVMGDRVLLRQLFVNLVGNALKYRAEERAPHIIIAIDDAGADCDLTITDNGIGFAPDHAKRIFEVFRRLHSRDAYPGTGVGLALCHRIVERHGGMIRGEGRPGEGACFTISLPKRPVDRYSLMTGGDD